MTEQPKEYANHEGIVTDINQDDITIGGEKYLTTTFKSKCIINASQCGVGDPVIFNFNTATREIIYLHMKHPYYRGTEARAHNHSRYVEDPRDPDEVHDMAAVYGCEFEGM